MPLQMILVLVFETDFKGPIPFRGTNRRSTGFRVLFAAVFLVGSGSHTAKRRGPIPLTATI